MKYHPLYSYWLQLKESGWVFANELKRIFRDPGVMVIFLLGTLAYPLVYKALYWNEQISNVPVAVVDLSCSTESRAFLHTWNACPDIRLTHTCTSLFPTRLRPPIGRPARQGTYITLLRHVVLPLYEGYLSQLQQGHVGVDAEHSNRPLRADGYRP